jgi:glutamate 5-kinase
MRSKVIAADMATAAGIETVICNGERDGVLARVLAGDREGTLFRPRHQGYSSFKLWLKYAKPSRGTLHIDAGAARALREDGTSLLPVGVVAIEGEFEVGDAVEVSAETQLIGKGICNYSSEELDSAKGLKSAQVRALLPQAAEEAVHRDYFVLA